jgi:ubiquinol-cytochrome c reductase cytochrome c subunit
MRAVLTITVAAALLLAPASAEAATSHGGTPKEPLAAYGYHLYGQYCLSCHGPNAGGRLDEPSSATGAGPGRAQGQQGGIGPSLHGVALFTEHCAGCHQVLAQGGYLTGAVPAPLAQATPVQVAQAVRVGPYVMPKFSPQAISNRQLDSIVRYVEYTHDPARPGGWGIGFLGPVPEGLVTWFLAIPALIVLCLLLGRRLSR